MALKDINFHKIDLFKKQKNIEVSYMISLILSLILMVLAPTIMQLVYYIFISITNPTYYELLMTEGSIEYLKLLNETVYVFQFAGYILLLGLFPFLFLSTFKEDIKKFKEKYLKNIIIIVVGFVSMYLLTLLVNFIFDYFNFPQSSENQEGIENVLKSDISWIVIISVVILAPFVEEVIFRKMLFGVCEKTFRLKGIIAVIISTLIFSAIHISSEVTMVLEGADPIYLVAILLYLPISFVLALCYKLSNNNIYVAMAIHLLNNLVSVIMVLQ